MGNFSDCQCGQNVSAQFFWSARLDPTQKTNVLLLGTSSSHFHLAMITPFANKLVSPVSVTNVFHQGHLVYFLIFVDGESVCKAVSEF